MEIDWENITFSFDNEDLNFISYEPSSLIIQPAKRSRQEMEQEALIVKTDGNLRTSEAPQNKYIKKESEDTIYYCQTCSIDFPSIAYFKRHQDTKKHQHALKMEQRGKKTTQKRSYIRRNALKPGRREIEEVKQEELSFDIKQEFMTPNNQFQNITDLTLEEITLLHSIDDQIIKIESENTAKDFYENFDFDLDLENVEPTTKTQKFSSVEEIMADLITSSEPFMIQQIQAEDQQRLQKLQQTIKRIESQPKTKHQCPECPRTFNRSCHLTQHMNSVHSENRNFKCPICGKKYETQELLSQHIEKHSGEKPFKCTKCDKSYNNKVDLKRHAMTHEKVLDHICELCGWEFVRADHLQKHMEMHQRKRHLD